MIDAAVSAQVQHCVYSSVLHPFLRKLLNHDNKRYIKEHLIESSLPYTILQPSTFMDQFPIQKLLSEDELSSQPAATPTCLSPIQTFATWAKQPPKSSNSANFTITQHINSYPHPHPSTTDKSATSSARKLRGSQDWDFAVDADGRNGRGKSVEGMFGLEEGAYTRDAAQRMLLYHDDRKLVRSTNVLRSVLGGGDNRVGGEA